MKIAIFASIGSGNLGDELILKNEIKLLKEKYGNETQFKIFTYDLEDKFFEDKNLEYLEYFPIGIKNPKNIFRNLKNYYNFVETIKKVDKVVIGGGGIIFDNETGNYSNPLKQWLFRVYFAKFFKKEIIFYGVSIDIKNESNYEKIKNLFSPAKEIYVRDKNSCEFLKNLGINSEIILDPVFSDNGEVGLENYKKNFMIKKVNVGDFSLNDLENIDLKGKKVGLALRSGYLNDEKKIINEIIDFILEKGGKVILLPHSFHKIDKHANDYEFLKDFLRKGVEITKNMQETYISYKEGKIDFCLSMRLHSMILSQVYGIEFIALKYAKKGDLM